MLAGCNNSHITQSEEIVSAESSYIVNYQAPVLRTHFVLLDPQDSVPVHKGGTSKNRAFMGSFQIDIEDVQQGQEVRIKIFENQNYGTPLFDGVFKLGALLAQENPEVVIAGDWSQFQGAIAPTSELNAGKKIFFKKQAWAIAQQKQGPNAVDLEWHFLSGNGEKGWSQKTVVNMGKRNIFVVENNIFGQGAKSLRTQFVKSSQQISHPTQANQNITVCEFESGNHAHIAWVTESDYINTQNYLFSFMSNSHYNPSGTNPNKCADATKYVNGPIIGYTSGGQHSSSHPSWVLNGKGISIASFKYRTQVQPEINHNADIHTAHPTAHNAGIMAINDALDKMLTDGMQVKYYENGYKLSEAPYQKDPCNDFLGGQILHHRAATEKQIDYFVVEILDQPFENAFIKFVTHYLDNNAY